MGEASPASTGGLSRLYPQSRVPGSSPSPTPRLESGLGGWAALEWQVGLRWVSQGCVSWGGSELWAQNGPQVVLPKSTLQSEWDCSW